jgi:hypothetical protein
MTEFETFLYGKLDKASLIYTVPQDVISVIYKHWILDMDRQVSFKLMLENESEGIYNLIKDRYTVQQLVLGCIRYRYVPYILLDMILKSSDYMENMLNIEYNTQIINISLRRRVWSVYNWANGLDLILDADIRDKKRWIFLYYPEYNWITKKIIDHRSSDVNFRYMECYYFASCNNLEMLKYLYEIHGYKERLNFQNCFRLAFNCSRCHVNR